MSGRAGRSGRKALGAAHHLLAGTFRPDRHGPRPTLTAGTSVLRMPAQAVLPVVPAAVIEGLREPGLAFVLDLWAEYDNWSSSALVLLRQVGQAVDQLEDYRTRLGHDGYLLTTARGGRMANPLLRLQNQTRATLLALLSALNLKEK